jgi:hypothetical protein
MKKIVICYIFTLCVLVASSPISGGLTANITIDLNNNAAADIDITPPTWLTGAGIGADESSGEGGFFTIYNNGTLTVDIYMSGQDASIWTLENTAGHDNFALKYNFTDVGSWNSVTTSSSLWIDNFAYSTFKNFDLWLYMPTSTSTGDNQATNMTVTIQPS